jgi:uncharacterized membrane protein YsdA (DUF1294 family)
VFVHISAFGSGARRPVVGDRVTYSPETDERGRPRAREVRFVGRRPRAANRKEGRSLRGIDLLLLGAFLAFMAGTSFTGRLHPGVPALIALLSVATYLIYRGDKSAAKRGGWRTPESTLHVLAIAGGWPGALVAQQRFRHKSRKGSFQLLFWITVLVNCGAVVWATSDAGRDVIGSLVPGV